MTDIFVKQRQCLRLVGHNFVRDESSCLYKWRNIMHVVSLLLMLMIQGPLINYTMFHIDQLELATASLSISFTNFLTAIKTATFFFYKCRFMSIMRRLERMYEDLQEPISKEDLKKSNNYAMYVVKLYWVCVCSTGLYYIFTPMVIATWSYTRKTELKWELPMPMIYPFDYESTPGYQIAYFYTGIAIVLVIMYAVAIDGLFLSFCFNLVSHFKALQRFLKSNSFLQSDAVIHRNIRCYIIYHNVILQLYQEIRHIYSPIVFAQFLITSLQVCVIIYQIVTRFKSLLEFATNITFLCSILLQLLIYCYGAEMLKVESLMVGISVQLSNWYNLKPRHRRMMGLMMMRSQREAIIRGGFYEASLANFMVILKTAFSYIALIQSIEK